MHKAAEAAAQAQRDWAALPYDRRAAVLRRAGQLFVEHEDEIHEWLVRESGAIRPFAGFQTRAVAAEECWEAAGLASHPYGELLRSNQPRLSMARRLPVGVVGVIAPFNAPIILAIRAIAPALALGNAVVLQARPAHRGLRRSGVRPDLRGGRAAARACSTCCPAAPTSARRWSTTRVIRVIAFTGSTRAGKTIAAAAAQRLKRVHLELGGNSALIVLDDVDLEKAVSVGAFGSFNHAGQICMATSRHLVAASIAADYAAALAEHADRSAGRRPGRRRRRASARSSTSASATTSTASSPPRWTPVRTLRAGGTYEGLFYRPTVLSDVPLTAPAYAQEIFGPVAPVVAFSSLGRGRARWPAAPSTGCRWASSPAT